MYKNTLHCNLFSRLTLLALLLVCSTHASTQENSLIVEKAAMYQPSAIKLSLVHFMSANAPGPHLEFEHGGHNGFFWRHQLGTFFDLGYQDQAAIEDLKGIRISNGLRKYHQRNRNSRRTPFWEFQVDYRYLDVLIGGDFNRDGFNFSQRINYNMWQHSVSFNFIWGVAARLGKHLTLDLGVGAGVRVNHRQYSPVPDDTSFSTNGSLYLWRYGDRERWHATLSVPVIASLGYVW